MTEDTPTADGTDAGTDLQFDPEPERPDRGELAMSEHDMRFVEVLVLTDTARRRVTALLAEGDIDFVLSEGEDGARVSAPMPTGTVEHLQRRLEELEVHDGLYTVVIEPEAVVSDRFDADPDTGTHTTLGSRGVSGSELHAAATGLLPDLPIYALLTAISAVVATAGVLMNSLPVLVGSMVIAPLMGPIMAASVATIISDDRLFERSWKYQVAGLGVGLASAVGFATLARVTDVLGPDPHISELVAVSSHTAPSGLLVVVALAAGFAGALSLSTGGGIDLVGVMIAAAIMPPIGVVGVAVAWLQPGVVVGALAVVLANLASVSLSSIVSLWYLGYHPESLHELRRARGTMLVRALVLAVAVLVFAAVLTHVSGRGLPLEVGL
jgi:uncharacterized hydrophobic protein (TIGR00341 family)